MGQSEARARVQVFRFLPRPSLPAAPSLFLLPSLLDKRPPLPWAPARTQRSVWAAGRYLLGEPDFYFLRHPSLTSPHWLRGSVQVGTVSPAGQDSRLPVVFSCPCLDAPMPSGHQVSLSCGSHCLCPSSRHFPGPLPENHPSCWTLLHLALAPFTPAGCHGRLWALLGRLSTS